MKPSTSSRKVGTIIFSAFILATAVLIVGNFIQRSKLTVQQTIRTLPENGQSKSTPRTRPLLTDEVVAIAERDGTANAQPCDHTVLTNLDLSRPPTQAELIAAGNLGEKLTPTRSASPESLSNPAALKRQELDNLTFGTAIQAWNDHRYDEALRLFTEHLEAFPDSPWAAESMLHIGCHHQYVARFSESVEWFDKILATAPPTSEMYHKAKLRRSILNVDLGRLDEATKGFTEMMQNDPDSNHQSYASYWLIQTELLRKNETALRDCGQKALSHAAKILGDATQAETLYELTAAGPHGYTAAELHATALKHGFQSRPVQAMSALDTLPLPFIAHYTDRHYVTVEFVSEDTVKLYDSRIAATTAMPIASFRKNWSGFALLLKPAPESPNIHDAENLNDIIGGCCGQPTQVSDLGKDGCDKSCGLPSYNVNPINMNFNVIDTPIWWDAPVGSPVDMTLVFNSQDSLNNFEPFGEKWSFEYVSYLLITPGNRVQVKDGDGRLETFPAPVGGIPEPVVYPVTYQSPPGDFRVLTQTGLHNFILIGQDGTEYRYGIPAAMPGTTSVPLLLSIKDRHDNTLSITHNANGAITAVSHSALPNQSWRFVYSPIDGTYSRVTRIDDPFSRSSHFNYDNQGRLTGQTDMGGLTYSYTYTAKNTIDNTANYLGQTAAPQLLIDSITTPTGTTSILTEPADGINIADAIYTSEELAAGYQPYTVNSYPPPGKPMWTNYRITLKDHIQAPTEYYFCGYDSVRYVRNPAQMYRAHGFIRPNQGSRLQMETALVGGKGAINFSRVYDENSNPVSSSFSASYNQTTRLASSVPDGNNGSHYLEYNSAGKPTLVELHSRYEEDQHITTTYIQPLGVDVDTVKRKFKETNGTYTLKTLADYNYYPNRDLQSVTDVNGRVITYLWYPNGLIQKITDSATSDVLDFFYDTNLRPSTVKVNTVIVLSTAYDIKGNLQSSMNTSGRLVSFSYDNLNRLTREVGADNSFTAYQWACCFIDTVRSGKIINGAEKTLLRSVTLHDARALPLNTTDSDGKVTQYQFDIAGRFTNLIDPKGQETRWEYNAASQLKKKIYPGNSFEEFTYVSVASAWGMGKIKTFKNRRGATTTYDYEYDGQLNTITKPNAERGLAYDYDTWRRIKTITQNAEGGFPAEAHTFVHDLLARPTSIDGPWSDDTIGYAYNDALRTVTRTSPGGITQTTTANAAGQIASIANPLGTFTNTYSVLGGQLTNVTHTGANAGFNTAFTYHGDSFDRALHTLTSSKSGGATISKHTYTYDTFGNIDSWKREAPLANPTGLTRQFDSKVYYDRAEQVSSVIHTPLAGSSVIESAQHYTYDAAGNIASRQVETPGATSIMVPYSHNSQNQLTSIGGSSGLRSMTVRGTTSESAQVKAKATPAGSAWKNARMLDGNRFEAELDLATGPNTLDLQAKDGSNNTSSYTYSLNLASTTSTAPIHDADGNMTSDGTGRTFQWDSQSRLTNITWAAGKSSAFKYNALGHRSSRIDTDGAIVTHYHSLYEGIHLLDRRTGNATPSSSTIDRRYFNQGEQRRTGSTWASYYYNRDHLGSIREVMNSGGSLAARYDYDPYGKRQTQYLSANYTGGCDLGYTGHITQPSSVSGQGEIVLTLFRAFDPALGRWLSADPLGEAGGMNLYAYCYGNPLNLYDPDGMWPARPEWMLTNAEIGDALNDGFFATLDGAIPFADPFADAGKYDQCESGVSTSQFFGGISRDAAIALATGGGSTFANAAAQAKNPLLYELGSTTVSPGTWRFLKHTSVVNRGRILAAKHGGIMKAFAAESSFFRALPNAGSGLTPLGSAIAAGGLHAADAATNSSDCD